MREKTNSYEPRPLTPEHFDVFDVCATANFGDQLVIARILISGPICFFVTFGVLYALEVGFWLSVAVAWLLGVMSVVAVAITTNGRSNAVSRTLLRSKSHMDGPGRANPAEASEFGRLD